VTIYSSRQHFRDYPTYIHKTCDDFTTQHLSNDYSKLTLSNNYNHKQTKAKQGKSEKQNINQNKRKDLGEFWNNHHYKKY